MRLCEVVRSSAKSATEGEAQRPGRVWGGGKEREGTRVNREPAAVRSLSRTGNKEEGRRSMEGGEIGGTGWIDDGRIQGGRRMRWDWE